MPDGSEEAVTAHGGANASKRPRGLLRLVAVLNSRAMRVLDWTGALACILVGIYLVRSTDAPTTSDWFWLVGGLIGLLFAIFRPAQRAASNLSAAIRKNPPVPRN